MMRNLYPEEIATMTANGCRAENWQDITVADGFDAVCCRNVRFSGKCSIGAHGYKFVRPGNFAVEAGLNDVALHDCHIGDYVYINRVANYIAGYRIDDYAFIENVGSIVATGESSFGNGVEVSVLNETGGREVPMYDRMSAQVAYLMAMYRHRQNMIDKMHAMVAAYAAERGAEQAHIGKCAVVVNTGVIQDVNVGDYARVEGAARLINGTIAGSQADPVYVGDNVMATDFILSSGAHVADSVVLLHTFVGQATHLTHLFSAHDSLFFANCACENGEAAAIFAGPYTVTMHKSSLLIAGMFSFLNAGSGSNQSNHMYKLGPIHQGVVERGSKTTSDSYILWPARIGAFSLVMGRHVNHPDTSRLPFSYLIENSGGSYLVPGVNLKSVGTIRDARKWPRRDRRRDPDRLDQINFNLLSPYTVSRMMGGISLLDEIEQTGGPTSPQYTYQAMTIEARALRKGREYYALAIDKFMGNSVIKRLEGLEYNDAESIRQRLRPTAPCGEGLWVDISGMLAPKSEISRLCSDIEDGTCATLADVEKRMRALQENYYDMEWTWVVDNFRAWWGKDVDELEAKDIVEIVSRWIRSVTRIDEMLYDDARKEFSLVSRIGFGVDGNTGCKIEDFDHVRGSFDKDPFVRMVLDHIAVKTELGNELVGRMTR